MATETTVKSVLCRGWSWPLFLGSSIGFEENGTGNLVCGIESALFIAAEIDWKPLGDCPATLERKVDMSNDFQVSLDIEITLTKRTIGAESWPPGWINETNLFDSAFRPRIYKIELAKGRFYKPDWLVYEGEASKPPKDPERWHALRLVFDQSPYPPLEEWKEDVDFGIPWRAAKGNRWWKFRDFYAHTEESTPRPPVIDEKTRVEKRRKALEKLREINAMREEEKKKSRSA